MKTKDEKIERLHGQLKLANAALKVATNNVVEARHNVEWATKKLQEAQEENRVLKRAMIAAYEPPPCERVERVAEQLEANGGFVNRNLANEAASLLRELWRSCNGRSS